MTYGFKFINDLSKVVIDDSNVKPWYIAENTGGANLYGYCYKITDISSNFEEWGSFNPIFNTGERIYELRYVAPPLTDCLFAYTLPPGAYAYVAYATQEEGPISLANSTKTEYVSVLGATYPYISIFAFINEAWLASATPAQMSAAVPKVYFFANKAIPNSILGTNAGIQVFDAGAECMYDSNKLHIKLENYSFQGWRMPAPYPLPQNAGVVGGPMESYFTEVSTGGVPYATDMAYVIPSVITKWYWEQDRPAANPPGIYGAFLIFRQFVSFDHNTGGAGFVAIKNVNVTSQLTYNLGLGQVLTGATPNTWWNYGSGVPGSGFQINIDEYRMQVLAIKSAVLDRGYTPGQFPSTYSLTSSIASPPENDSGTNISSVTITLRTTNVVNGTQVPYTITGTNITASDIGSVYRNGEFVSGGSLTGYFTTNNNISTILLNIVEDYITEGTETLTLTLNNGMATVSISITEDKAYAISFITTPDSILNGIPQFNESSNGVSKAILFQVKTKNVPVGTVFNWDYVYSGTFNISDLEDNQIDPLTVEARTLGEALQDGFNGRAYTIFLIKADGVTEGTERARVRLTNFPSLYLDFDILDTSLGTPTFTIRNPNGNTDGSVFLDEGTTYTWSVQTLNLPEGTRVFPKLVYNTATAADLTLGSPADGTGWSPSTGIAVTNQTLGYRFADFTITPTADNQLEGSQNFTVVLEYPLGTVVKTYNGTVYINDTSKPAEVYTLTVANQFVNEGQVIEITFTSNLDYAHPVNWNWEGVDLGSPYGALSLADIASMRYEDPDYLTSGGPQYTNITKSLSGSFSFPTSGILTSNLRYKLLLTVLNDGSVEPYEYGQLYFRPTGGANGSIYDIKGFFVVDAPTSTYSIDANATTRNEGDTLTWTITTTNVTNGTVLYWISAGSAQNIDYNDNLYGGTVTINGNTGTVSRVIKADAGAYEGPETAKLQLYADSNYVNFLAEYNGFVTINDTSNNVNEVVSFTPSSVVYPNGGTFAVTGGVPNGTYRYSVNSTNYDSPTQYLNASGNATASPAGSSGAGLAAGSYTIYVYFVDTGHTRQVSFTVTSPTPTYSFVRDQSLVNETTNRLITYTVTTTNVPDGTRIYWINYGSTDANDFTAFTNEGFVTISNNTASFNRNLRTDATTEGEETVFIFFYADSGYNDILGYAGQTTVTDTSVTATPVYNEVVSVTPSSVVSPNGVTFSITGGTPNGTYRFSVNSTNYDSPTYSLDANGNVTGPTGGAGAGFNPGTYTIYVYFVNTGNTRQTNSWTVTAANPAAGTLLSTDCVGTTRWGVYADGSGGTYRQVLETNSTFCGYTPPAGQVVSNYSSTTNDPGNTDVEGSPSAAYDGIRSRGVGRNLIDSQVTRTFTVSQAGTITAYLIVGSEADYDFGEIYFDNVQYARGSGNYNSGPLTGPITAGTHTIKVRYTKDGSVSGGDDSAFGYWSIT